MWRIQTLEVRVPRTAAAGRTHVLGAGPARRLLVPPASQEESGEEHRGPEWRPGEELGPRWRGGASAGELSLFVVVCVCVCVCVRVCVCVYSGHLRGCRHAALPGAAAMCPAARHRVGQHHGEDGSRSGTLWFFGRIFVRNTKQIMFKVQWCEASVRVSTSYLWRIKYMFYILLKYTFPTSPNSSHCTDLYVLKSQIRTRLFRAALMCDLGYYCFYL